MININRTMVLDFFIKHKTLAITDIANEKNLGIVPKTALLNYLMSDLVERGEIRALDGVIPIAYTITTKGIQEGKRLQAL